ncbi:ribokinase [Vagococcus acidifermentans]|uniref:Ribokinase n=1 Tax=Vagococcus acidifermentans TaxID=564710 RepID=A0A430B352_9ENTE|nr:ribokinase [Vagococcus acidifermentans]RSU14753.1 ribokinase [Vagococcus acidifermentans]
MKKVAVIGSISTDFVVSTDVIPMQGQTVVGKDFKTFFGGKGANQAIAVSRSGIETFMVGAVGDDIFGTALLENLQINQINIDMVAIKKNTSSGSAFIQVKDGDNRITVIEGANGKVTVKDVQMIHPKLLEMDMVVLQNEMAVEVIEHVLAFCAQNNITVLYNPAPVKSIPSEILADVDFLTPNEHEFKMLFDNQTIADVLPKFPNKLIVTLGDKGAVYHNGQEQVLIPAEKITEVVDTTGAGDTFNGYLVRGILSKQPLDDVIRFANKAAAMAIQKPGAQQGIPYWNEVK